MMIDGHIGAAKVGGRRKQSAPSSRAEAQIEAASGKSVKSESRLNSLGRQLLCGFITGSGHHTQAERSSPAGSSSPAARHHHSFVAQFRGSPKHGKSSGKQAPPAKSTSATSNDESSEHRKSFSAEENARAQLSDELGRHSTAASGRVNITGGASGSAVGSESRRLNSASEEQRRGCARQRDGEPPPPPQQQQQRHLVRMMANESFMGAGLGGEGAASAPGQETKKTSGAESPRRQLQPQPQQQPTDPTDRLICLLDQLTSHKWQQTSAAEPDDCQDLQLEGSWCEFVAIDEELASFRVEWPESLRQQLLANLRLQQDAIWELLSTEVNYIKCLKVIVDTFLLTLDKLHANGLLLQVDAQRLASNVDEIYRANRVFWTRHLAPMVRRARDTRSPMNPAEVLPAFVEIRHLFRPYYRYCLEHTTCLRELKELNARDDQFRLYLAWCEGQPECERLKLVDLLAKPMQRLTRYSLLLRSIEKRTDDQGQCRALEQMLAYTNRFVLTVDLELRQKDELELLVASARRVDASDCGHHDNFTDEVHQILRDYSRFDLLAPMFPAACPFECHRQLIFDSQRLTQGANLGQLRFRDAQTSAKIDVVLILLTDHLLVCKQTAASLSQQPNLAPGKSNNSSSAINANQQQGAWWCSQPASGANSKLQSPSRSAKANTAAAPSPSRRLNENRVSAQNHLSPATQSGTGNRPTLLCEMTHDHQCGADHGPGCGVSMHLDPDDESADATRDKRTRSMSTSTRDHILEAPSGCARGDRISVTQQHNGPRSGQAQRRSFSHQTASNWSLSGALGHSSAPRSRQHSTQCEPTQATATSQAWPSAFGSHLSIATNASSDLLGAQLPALKVIRPPYPVERLVMHELRDGLGVLVCQLNDNLTLASSFVVFCSPPSESRGQQADSWSPQSSGKGRGNKSPGSGGGQFLRAQFDSSRSDSESLQQLEGVDSRRSSVNSRSGGGSPRNRPASQVPPARRLVNLIRQAQVRFHLAAYLHQVDLTISSTLLTERPAHMQAEDSDHHHHHHHQQQQQPTQRPATHSSPKIHHNFGAWSLRSIRSRSASGSNKRSLQKRPSRTEMEHQQADSSRHGSFTVPTDRQQDSSDNAHSDTQLDSRRNSRHFTVSIGRRSASSENQQSGSMEQPEQRSGRNSPSNSAAGQQPRCWPKVEPDPMLKAIMEQHQSFLLNHGQHDILATHEFRYPIFDRNYLHVKPVPYSLVASYARHFASTDSTSGQPLDGRDSSETVSTVRHQQPAARIDPRHLSADYTPERSGSTRSGSQSSVFYDNSAALSADHQHQPAGSQRQFLSPRVARDYRHQSGARLSVRSAEIPVVASSSTVTNSTSSSARSSPIYVKSSTRIQPTHSSPHLHHHHHQQHQQHPTSAESNIRRNLSDQQQAGDSRAIGQRNPVLTLSSSSSKSRDSLQSPGSPQIRPARRNICLLRRQHVIPSVCCDQELRYLDHKPLNHSSLELNTETTTSGTTPPDSTHSSVNVTGSRRNKFVAQHQRDHQLNAHGRANSSQATTADQTSATLDDSSVELLTLEQTLDSRTSQCAQCLAERDKQASVSFELGNLGHRKSPPGVDAGYFCSRHSCLSRDKHASGGEHNGPRSTSMESARSPVAVTLTFDDDGRDLSNSMDPLELGNDYQSRQSSPSAFLSIPRNVQTRRSFAAQGDSSYLSANRCKSLSPIHSSCASPQGTVTPQRSQATTDHTWLAMNSSLDKCSSQGNSMGSLNTPSLASNSPVFVDSDLDQSFEEQDSSRNNSSSSNPVHRRRVPLLNVTSASPQALECSYEFPGDFQSAVGSRRALELRKPSSTGNLERSGCRSSNSSDGDSIPVQRRAAMLLSRHYRTKLHFRCKSNLSAGECHEKPAAPSEQPTRAMSSDHEAYMQRRHLLAAEVGKAASAEQLDPLDCECPAGALLDVDCIGELVREANQLNDSIDAESSSSNQGAGYLGFHEKLERHNRRVKSGLYDASSDADYMPPVVLDECIKRNTSTTSSGKMSARWPFGQLMRQKAPLVNLRGSFFALNSQQTPAKSPQRRPAQASQPPQATGGGRARGNAMAAHQRALNLTRSMTSEIFESIWRSKPLTRMSSKTGGQPSV